jgi:hypothetical protein
MKKSTMILVIFIMGMFSNISLFAQYQYLGIVGDAAPIGWNPAGDAMTKDSSNPNVFTYKSVLKAGKFKIHAEAADWCVGNWLNSAVPNQTLSATEFIITTGCDGPDNQWEVTQKGSYSITVDLEAGAINIVSLDYFPGLFLIGSAMPAGWDLGLAPNMTVDPSNPAVYKWTGSLSEGSFKIGTAKTFDGGWSWIHPLTQGQAWTNTAYEVVEAGSGTDNQWAVDAASAGEYTVTVNLATQTIVIEKAPQTSVIAVKKSAPKFYVDKTNTKLEASGMEGFNYLIYSVTGNVVKSNYSIGGPIDISSLQSGMYILRTTSKEAGNLVFKFVKN